jgi:drug/metabolite transporter (DMT)-like permease
MRAFCGVCGCVFAIAVALARQEDLMPPRTQWGRLFVFAMLNYGAYIVFSTEAQVYLPAAEAIVITYTLPIWASLLAWPMLGERPSWRQCLALVFAIGGVALLVGVGSTGAQGGNKWEQAPGVAMGLSGAVLFGLGTVLAKQKPLALPPATSVAWQVGFGTAVLLLPAAFESPDWSRMTPAGWACVTYVATIPMTVAYLAWFRALRLVPASMAATTVLVSPMVGVLGGTLVLGETLSVQQMVALALTMTGVALAARG